MRHSSAGDSLDFRTWLPVCLLCFHRKEPVSFFSPHSPSPCPCVYVCVCVCVCVCSCKNENNTAAEQFTKKEDWWNEKQNVIFHFICLPLCWQPDITGTYCLNTHTHTQLEEWLMTFSERSGVAAKKASYPIYFVVRSWIGQILKEHNLTVGTSVCIQQTHPRCL